MKITKLGHSCLLVEEGQLRLLIDPGAWNELLQLDKLDLIFISHEHPDHLDLGKIKTILTAKLVPIYTNQDVAKKLDEAGINNYQLIEKRPEVSIKGVALKFFDERHAPVYPTLPTVKNTGILVNKKLFFPGDLFMEAPEGVEILALPVVAPWLKLSEAIDYTKKIKPKHCFPIHDGSLKYPGPSLSLPGNILSTERVDYQVLELNKPYEF